MFRRLQEISEGYSPHSDYITEQQNYIESRPNMIPSATSGLKGFDNAIRTAISHTGIDYQPYAIKNPNDIFMQTTSPDLRSMAAACAAGSIDDLIRDKRPSDRVGCGWVYTPNKNSPYPDVSRGALGDRNAPSSAVDVPSHKKWFFNLQEAKRTILMDKCKSLKSCSDVDNAVYTGVCGFCADTNQGIPIDSSGKPLYNDARASCSSGSIITSKGACPVPITDGPRAIRDRTCDPVNGRLSMGCLHQTVLSAGCNDNGALANALAGSKRDMDRLSQSNSVQIYNRVANPPLNIGLLKEGNTTVANVLQEVKQLSGNTSQVATSALGAAARDLCLQRGAINGYDPCNDLTDASTSPFDIRCLQRFFLKMGGTARGRVYPSEANIGNYNALGTLGAVKQYWLKLMREMKGGEGFIDYQTQSGALQDVLGIVPEQLISRAPYKQGVEVFWFVALPMQPGRVIGFLKRTIEPQFVQFQAGPSNVPQLGGLGYGCMLQLTDIRARADSSILFNITVDDGFWIAVNQPAEIDETAMSQVGYSVDKPGLFENLGLQGPTAYQSQACTPFRKNTPNIMKMYHEDAGGGWSAFTINNISTCSGDNGWNLFNGMYASLTCEIRAPFICYEVSKRGRFEELRNPGLFANFSPITNVNYHVRSDERQSVPGKKPFVRVNTATTMINIANIAYQSWKTLTFAIRLQSMPVKDSIIELTMGGAYFFNVHCENNGSRATVVVEHNVGGNGVQSATAAWQLGINEWYLFRIDNLGTGFTLYCDWIPTLLRDKRQSGPTIRASGPRQVWGPNATWTPAPGQTYETCNIMFGTQGLRGAWSSMYATGACNYDLAWLHFFDGEVNDNDIYRDAMSNWVYTQFPSSYDNYST